MTILLTNPNPNQGDDITGVSITDAYPASMQNADTTPVVSDSCGFTEDVPAGMSTANLTAGTVPAGSSCSIVITVVGTAPIDAENHTGPITSSNAPDGADASATLLIGLPPPIVTTSFAAPSVSVGGTSQLNIELANPNQLDAITNVAFTDNYPVPLHMANAATDIVVRNTCNGNLDAPAGSGSIALSGGTVPAGHGCSITVNVVGTAIGAVDNHTGTVTSDNAKDGADASATLTITHFPLETAPGVSAQFSPDTIGAGGLSKLTITLTNPNGLPTGHPITGIQISDVYASGITNAPSTPIDSDTCGFVEDVPPGGASAHFANGTIPAGGTCAVVVNVVGTATTSNDTGPVLSGNAEAGQSATATLTIDPNTPVVACQLPNQIGDVDDAIDIDLTKLFSPAPGQSVDYTATNLPPSLSIVGSELVGTLDTTGAYAVILTATDSNPGGASVDETVNFLVLPALDTVRRNGFDGTPCP